MTARPATAEAVLMAQRVTRRERVVFSGKLHPHYTETARTLGELITATWWWRRRRREAPKTWPR